ncbi:MAG: hypothetical protein WA919_13480 [Coleofasciculaceae cyanobacterium]
MNSENLWQILQTGFRATLGATTALVESVQDPQKREENFSKLTSDFGQQVTDWVEKGAKTEEEARSFLDQMLNQQGTSSSSSTTVEVRDVPEPMTNTAPPGVQRTLEELTAQISAIRTELETFRSNREDN